MKHVGGRWSEGLMQIVQLVLDHDEMRFGKTSLSELENQLTRAITLNIQWK